MKTHLRLAATFFFLFAASLKAGEISYAVGDTINLPLPDGLPSFSLSIVAAPPAGIAGQSYIARDTQSQSSAIVKPTKDGLRVTIDDFEHQKIYSVRVSNGVVEASVRDTSGAEGDVCGTCGGDIAMPLTDQVPVATNEAVSAATPRQALRLKSAMRSSGNEFPLAEQKAVVDILVAFDQGAKAKCAALGFDSIDDFADYAVNKMNTVLANSQLDNLFSYRLVGVVEINGTWNEINDALLGSLRTREGGFSKFSQLREKCGADTITLLIDKTVGTTTGIAYGYYLSGGYDVPSKFDSGNYACNVCDIDTVYSRYTMSHETGHNMGCGHSNRQGSNSGPGRYSDSCGYHFTDTNGTGRSTVMAYTYASGAGYEGYYYDPVPYFSTPDISPAEYGCALGEEGVNNNRRTLTLTYGDIAGLREHVVPYEWDVRVWEGERELTEGDYCEYNTYGNHTLTLTHANSEAVIYYTLDGNDPNTLSEHILSGGTISVNLEEDKTLKVCAVIGDEAQSVRTLTLREGIGWSGESGQSGNGRWSNDQSILSWCNGERPFEKWATVVFPDNVQSHSISVAVIGEISPWSTAFTAIDTAYTFNRNDAESLLKFRDAAFSPSGDLTFNVPVQMSATSFTTPAGSTIAFNAPFGQSVDAANGNCTNSIVVGNHGTLVVAPGAGKTQTFDTFNNTGNYYSTATLQVGAGTVRFKGPINGGAGLFGSTKIAVGDGGNLVFDVGGPTGYSVNNSSLTIDRDASVTFNQMEHLRRSLYLNGGVIYAKRLDLMSNPGIYVGDDSSVEDLGGGYLQIRSADASVDVADGKVLTLNLGTNDRDTSDANGKGLVKTGGGELAANRPMLHTGATIVSNGTLTVGYVSSVRVGRGWTIKNGATLKLKRGCALAVPVLALESGATLALPATNAAPLSATNEVSLSGVRLSLDGADDLSGGKSYPIISSSGGFAGVSGIVTDDLPELAVGNVWEPEVEGETLYVKVVERVLDIPMGETVNLSDVPSTVVSITGEGTLLCNGNLAADSLAALRGYVANDGWRGTVAFTNYAVTTLALDWYGGASSTVRLTGVSGYPGNSGNTNIYFHTTVELVDGADGKPAWTLNNGFSTDCTFIDRLRGDGTFKSTPSPSSTYVRQGFVVADASGFTGSLDLVGTQFTFGSTARKNDGSQTGTIYVDAGYSVTNAASWKAPGLVVNGELVKKGTLTIANSVAFGDGASFVVDSLPANGVVLTSKAITTNGVLSVGVMDDGRSYVANVVDNGDSTVSLVLEKAPLPAKVRASITVQYYDGIWKERVLDFELPTAWITNYYPTLETVEAVAAKYDEDAANGAKVWQCYMLGLDPTDAASAVSLSMAVVGNEIRFAVEGLGETHALDGIKVYWYMKTSTNLVTDASFSKTRDSAFGLSPTFSAHAMPDKPTISSTATAGTLFYKITVTFVAED